MKHRKAILIKKIAERLKTLIKSILKSVKVKQKNQKPKTFRDGFKIYDKLIIPQSPFFHLYNGRI